MHGVIKGDYHGTHNHESEIQHLTLSQKEKEKIAGTLRYTQLIRLYYDLYL